MVMQEAPYRNPSSMEESALGSSVIVWGYVLGTLVVETRPIDLIPTTRAILNFGAWQVMDAP